MKPFVADPDFTLHLGDCIETMRALPDASIDAVVTDPPYMEALGRARTARERAPFSGGAV